MSETFTYPSAYDTRGAQVRGNQLYANVGPDGIVVFEKHADPALSRLPVLIGEAAKVTATIRRWASLHPDGETYYLPSVAHAGNQAIAVDELTAWRERLTALY